MEETGITARIFPKYEKESTIIIFIFLNHQTDMFERNIHVEEKLMLYKFIVNPVLT